MIRPVGVDHADLRNGGIPVLTAEILLAETDVVKIHGQGQLIPQGGKGILGKIDEALQGLYLRGDLILYVQGIHGIQGGFSGLHRVDHIMLDGGKLRLGELTVKLVDPCSPYKGPVSLGKDLDTLGCAVCPLVILTGQIFHGKNRAFGLGKAGKDLILLRQSPALCLCAVIVLCGNGIKMVRYQIQLRLGKDGVSCLFKDLR